MDNTMQVSQTALENAATCISTLPSTKWAGRIIYLLETLEEKTESYLAVAVLSDIQQAISERLATGRW